MTCAFYVHMLNSKGNYTKYVFVYNGNFTAANVFPEDVW